MLVLLLISAVQAVWTGQSKQSPCLDYSEGRRAKATRLREGTECVDTSGDVFIGFMCNYEACAAATKNLGGQVFKWGETNGKFTEDRTYRKSKAGWQTGTECWMIDTDVNNICNDKVKNWAQYDLYKVDDSPNGAKAKVVKKGVECNSGDTQVTENGAVGGVLECRNAVRARGGKYFIFGKPRTGKEFSCWMEKTRSASCPEGWENDGYDFWEVTQPTVTDATYSCAGRCGGGTDCDEESGQCRKNGKPATTCRGKCGWGNCCNMAKIRCEPCGVSQAFADAMTVTAKTSDQHGPSFAVNAFAVFGFGVMLYGAGRFYLSK